MNLEPVLPFGQEVLLVQVLQRLQVAGLIGQHPLEERGHRRAGAPLGHPLVEIDGALFQVNGVDQRLAGIGLGA